MTRALSRDLAAKGVLVNAVAPGLIETEMLKRMRQAKNVIEANALEVGCNGNLNVVVVVGGRAAHSARPWLGDNAIHAAIGDMLAQSLLQGSKNSAEEGAAPTHGVARPGIGALFCPRRPAWRTARWRC